MLVASLRQSSYNRIRFAVIAHSIIHGEKTWQPIINAKILGVLTLILDGFLFVDEKVVGDLAEEIRDWSYEQLKLWSYSVIKTPPVMALVPKQYFTMKRKLGIQFGSAEIGSQDRVVSFCNGYIFQWDINYNLGNSVVWQQAPQISRFEP